jgi:hypothetical protein
VGLGMLPTEPNVENVENLKLKKMNSWQYREMGSRDKKGNLKYYNVTVTDWKISDCECAARQFRPYSPCKHMKRLNEKLTHLKI